MAGFLGFRKQKPPIVIHRIGVDVQVFFRSDAEASRGAGWSRSVMRELPRVPARGEYLALVLGDDADFAWYRVDVVMQTPVRARDGKANASQVFTTRIDGRAEIERISHHYRMVVSVAKT
jgi:hypothetical protein